MLYRYREPYAITVSPMPLPWALCRYRESYAIPTRQRFRFRRQRGTGRCIGALASQQRSGVFQRHSRQHKLREAVVAGGGGCRRRRVDARHRCRADGDARRRVTHAKALSAQRRDYAAVRFDGERRRVARFDATIRLVDGSRLRYVSDPREL